VIRHKVALVFLFVCVSTILYSEQTPERARDSQDMYQLIQTLQGEWSFVENDVAGQNSPPKEVRGTEKWTASSDNLVRLRSTKMARSLNMR
jgi:hypothetical protein